MHVGLRHFDSQTLEWLSRRLRSGEATRHVADLTVLGRERPETPATEVFPEEDIDLLHTLLEAQGHRNVERAPDIRAVVIDLGRLVGSHPSSRQQLPRTKKVC